MTWPFTSRGASAQEVIAEHRGFRGRVATPRVSRDQALRHSAVWACLRLRADLISTMPVDVFRRVAGVQVEQKKPPVLVTPAGPASDWPEWAYATQVDLDSAGNTVGVIKALDGLGNPARIELVNIDEVTFRGTGAELTEVRVNGEKVPLSLLWHEKQYTLAGIPVGLSPIAYAALTLDTGLSAQRFASEWFGGGARPAQHLKNTQKVLNADQSEIVKERFLASADAGGVFVSGADWELHMLGVKANEAAFLESIKATVPDVCRFLGVPGDMIDAETSTGHVTYANVTQRNLQLLIMNIGPAIVRRETRLSRLVAGDRFVKLNTNALLRMDLRSRFEAYKVGVDGRWLPPSRILELENMPPLTPEEEAEFARLFPNKTPAPAPSPTGGP